MIYPIYYMGQILLKHSLTFVPAANRMLTAIVNVADHIAAQAGFGFRADLQSLDVDATIMADLNLSQEQLDAVKENLPQAFEEIEATFG